MNTKETLLLLKEIRQEITRVNQAAGQTVFNPALTQELNALELSITLDVQAEEARRQSYSPLVQQKLREAGV